MRLAFRPIMATLIFFLSMPLWAGQTYQLRVDGLACAYCAYGIEKAFMQTEGVKYVDIDFEQGLVLVDVEDGVHFEETQLKEIVNDAGFTLRSVTVESNEGTQ